MATDAGPGTLAHALQLVLEIVETEVVGGSPPGVARLAAQLDLHESQVSRILKDLQALEIVERDEPTRGFLAGPRYFRLAAAGLDAELTERARPTLRALATRFGAPALLAVRSSDLALTIGAELPRGALRLASSTWWRSCWCTGAGRALLLDHSAEELSELFDGEAFDEGGPRAARDLGDLASRIAEDARQGVVVADSEFEHAVIEVAAPVRDPDGAIRAAVAVAIPLPAAERVRNELVRAVREAAALLGDQRG
jgi:DNA-binding IclR family transcriptional regulator